MDWRLLLDYFKFFGSVGILVLAYFVQMKHWEVIIIIASGAILTTGVNVTFPRSKSSKKSSASSKTLVKEPETEPKAK